MHAIRHTFGGLALVLGALALMTACEQGPQAVDVQEPTVNLTTSDQTIMAGETTTLFLETSNLLGRDVEIAWDTSLGEIQPEANGRMARFTSRQPGTAVITTELTVDGRVIRDQVNVTINPIESAR